MGNCVAPPAAGIVETPVITSVGPPIDVVQKIASVTSTTNINLEQGQVSAQVFDDPLLHVIMQMAGEGRPLLHCGERTASNMMKNQITGAEGMAMAFAAVSGAGANVQSNLEYDLFFGPPAPTQIETMMVAIPLIFNMTHQRVGLFTPIKATEVSAYGLQGYQDTIMAYLQQGWRPVASIPMGAGGSFGMSAGGMYGGITNIGGGLTVKTVFQKVDIAAGAYIESMFLVFTQESRINMTRHGHRGMESVPFDMSPQLTEYGAQGWEFAGLMNVPDMSGGMMDGGGAMMGGPMGGPMMGGGPTMGGPMGGPMMGGPMGGVSTMSGTMGGPMHNGVISTKTHYVALLVRRESSKPVQYMQFTKHIESSISLTGFRTGPAARFHAKPLIVNGDIVPAVMSAAQNGWGIIAAVTLPVIMEGKSDMQVMFGGPRITRTPVQLYFGTSFGGYVNA
jgi:hypothetical protein